MSLIGRVAKLVNADINAVLDRIEEPEALLKQSIRDMEEELAVETQRIKWLRSEIEAHDARASAARKARDELDGKLDLCLSAGNDELGRKLTRRKLTRRKLQTELLARRLDEKKAALEKALLEQEKSYSEHEDQLAGMVQKAELLTATPQRAVESACDSDLVVGDDEVEIAFLREKQARSAR
jgi:phage shock protein A